MVQRQTVSDPRAAVVPDEVEGVETQCRHHLDLILRHRAFAIHAVVVRRGRRLIAVAVAPQVGCHDGVSLGQQRRHFVPFDVGLRIAVQQQYRRPAAAVYQIDGHTVYLEPCPGETVKHISRLHILT